MDMQELLRGLDNLLEDRATGDWVADNYKVVVAGTSILHGKMYISIQGNDGTVKHFRLNEV